MVDGQELTWLPAAIADMRHFDGIVMTGDDGCKGAKSGIPAIGAGVAMWMQCGDVFCRLGAVAIPMPDGMSAQEAKTAA